MSLPLTIVTHILILRASSLLPVVGNMFPSPVSCVLHHQRRTLKITTVHFSHCPGGVVVRRKSYEGEIAFHVYVTDSSVITEHVFQVSGASTGVETCHEYLVSFFVRTRSSARAG